MFMMAVQVKCRITGSSLVEGWSAASLRSSVLSAAVLRYQDLQAGAMVEGEIAAVETFGLLVKLGEGVRAVVPNIHLGDVAITNPKARFKVSFSSIRPDFLSYKDCIFIYRCSYRLGLIIPQRGVGCSLPRGCRRR